jgi:formamidopyrimidine-DNA glycosylase
MFRNGTQMPELPEVETTVRALRRPLIGRTITGVWNGWSRHIVTPAWPAFQQRITGRTFDAINRRAKYLVFNLSEEETLIIHLKMSGHLSVVDETIPADKHVHTLFQLDNGQALRFRDIRKFGRVYLVRDPQEILGHLGTEPLEPNFTVPVLQERLQNRKRLLKPLLLDQTFIAGIGNIYADEALFHASLHPARRTDTLSAGEVSALHKAILHVLQEGIAREGASISLYVKPDGERGDMQNAVAVFRRTGELCYRCGNRIDRMKLGGRSTHYCPICQT